MLRYACLRLALLVPVLLAASLIVFVLGRLAPGDPIALVLAEQQSHPDVVERIRAEFGLDKPVPVQYLYWLRQAATGDLGVSLFRFGRPVTAILAEGLATTVKLAAAALALAIVGGVTLGICGAVWRGTWIRKIWARCCAATRQRAPRWWAGTVATPPSIWATACSPISVIRTRMKTTRSGLCAPLSASLTPFRA